MKAQQEGKLSGIYGRLGDLGVIDSKYDVAVTTACNNLDSIVVETVEHGQKCLDFLKKNNIGRATFLILDKISWVEQKMRENFRAPNNCERLFDLIKYKNQRLATAFYFAVRDTLVAPDLKTASNVAYGHVRNRVVTLNGELIEVGENCNEKDFDSLLQDLMIPKVNSVVQTESICIKT
jgi:structural maintenance of chromosome 4